MTTEPTAPDLAPEPQTAQAKLDAIRNNPVHPYNVEGHPGWERARDEVLALGRAAVGDRNHAHRVVREEGDPPVAGASPAPLEPVEPVLGFGASWDAELTADLDATFTDAGLHRHAATAFRGVLAHEHNQGTLGRWTPETALAELERKYGPEQADEYIADAERAASLLKPRLKAWLASSGGHCNPNIITEAAALWRRKRTGG